VCCVVMERHARNPGCTLYTRLSCLCTEALSMLKVQCLFFIFYFLLRVLHSCFSAVARAQVLLVALTGDRGLCGGYNTYAIKKAEMRAKELQSQGIDFDMICIGNKGNTVRVPPPSIQVLRHVLSSVYSTGVHLVCVCLGGGRCAVGTGAAGLCGEGGELVVYIMFASVYYVYMQMV
jgi:hypothetical protein